MKTQPKNKTIKITLYFRTEEHLESQRKKLIRYFNQGAYECDGAESERYGYIAGSLSMGAIEVDSDQRNSIFPEGSEGYLLEEKLKKMGLFFD